MGCWKNLVLLDRVARKQEHINSPSNQPTTDRPVFRSLVHTHILLAKRAQVSDGLMAKIYLTKHRQYCTCERGVESGPMVVELLP